MQQKELSVFKKKGTVLISSTLAIKCQLNRKKNSPNDLIEGTLLTTPARIGLLASWCGTAIVIREL